MDYIWFCGKVDALGIANELSRTKNFKSEAVEKLSLVNHPGDRFDLKTRFCFRKSDNGLILGMADEKLRVF